MNDPRDFLSTVPEPIARMFGHARFRCAPPSEFASEPPLEDSDPMYPDGYPDEVVRERKVAASELARPGSDEMLIVGSNARIQIAKPQAEKFLEDDRDRWRKLAKSKGLKLNKLKKELRERTRDGSGETDQVWYDDLNAPISFVEEMEALVRESSTTAKEYVLTRIGRALVSGYLRENDLAMVEDFLPTLTLKLAALTGRSLDDFRAEVYCLTRECFFKAVGQLADERAKKRAKKSALDTWGKSPPRADETYVVNGEHRRVMASDRAGVCYKGEKNSKHFHTATMKEWCAWLLGVEPSGKPPITEPWAWTPES